MRFRSLLSLLPFLLVAPAIARDPDAGVVARDSAASTTPKYVFAHFILGVVKTYQQPDWETDMKLAQSIGIDAFALDIGKDPYNKAQLAFAYAAAEAVGFHVFISFDFAYWTTGDAGTVACYLSTLGGRKGQFLYNGKVFVSSFVGDSFPFRTVEQQSGLELFACPNWQAGTYINNKDADCGFNWSAWPNLNNQPIDSNYTTAGDKLYIENLAGRPYMAPVSPWFSSHYGASLNKNWIFYSDWLWQQRWDQILQEQPDLIEIITWNDFGESHYIGPLHPNDTDVYAGGANGAVEWVTGMTHDAWRDVAQVYITAYKAGASTPTVEKDELVYYYRPNPKGTTCTNDTVGIPTGSDFDADEVFVTAMLTQPGEVSIISGNSVAVTFNAVAGVNTFSAPMALGAQTFELSRGGSKVLSGTGSLEITDSCETYNFNAFVDRVM